MVIKLGDAYNNPNGIGGNGRGAVYDTNGICATIVTMSGGGNKPMVIVRGKDSNEQDNSTRKFKGRY